MFQSLIGFKINWNPIFLLPPFRFRQFQSLVGFKINWNLCNPYDLRHAWAVRFQSLVGFKINWNSLAADFLSLWQLFQSLVGFKINWNDFTGKEVIERFFVSIPSRV